MLIPIFFGIILLTFSWFISYPVTIDSPYDFRYNHISVFYWLSLPILFSSFFIVGMKTRNNILRWVMTVGTVLLMYSTAYFHYMIPGSDSHSFRGLTEYFVSTGDLSPAPHHDYYQWPLFFILNKMATSIIDFDLRYFEFVFYGTVGFVIISLIYLRTSKTGANGYLATTVLFIILSFFFNYQWAPFALSLIFILLLFYLDSISEKRIVVYVMLIIFSVLTYTHMLVPIFYIVYSFLMYVMKKNRRYLMLFLSTLIIYLMVQSYGQLFTPYVKQLANLHLLEFQHDIETTITSSGPLQPDIDVIAQFFSRIVVITTMIITGLGFIVLLIKRKFRVEDYAMLLTGMIFMVTLIVSIRAYSNMGHRAFFLIAIPASLGAAYLVEGRFKTYFKPTFMILLIAFTFVIVHKTFYDRQIVFQTRKEHHYANFMIDSIDWKNPHTSLLSHYRFMLYLKTKSASEKVMFKSDFSEGKLRNDFPLDIPNHTYIAYTVGLGKSFMRVNYSVDKSYEEFEINHFNLIYNSGDYSQVFMLPKIR